MNTRREVLELGAAALATPATNALAKTFGSPLHTTSSRNTGGRIFLSVAESPPDLSDPKISPSVYESFTWRFLTFDPSTGSWFELPGNAGCRFWVAPGAEKIVFLRNGALWLREGQELDRCFFELPTPTPFVHEGAWSPDGRRFAVSFAPLGVGMHDLFGSHQTWLLEIDGRGKTKLPIPGTDGVRDWSPDGEWLVTSCVRQSRDKRQMYLVRPDGTGRRQFATNGACTQGRFSPDGLQVASTRGARAGPNTPTDPRERGSVWLMDIDGAYDHMVFGHSELCCQDVRWSPDGMRLVFWAFERHAGPSPGDGRLDLTKPRVMLFATQGANLELLNPPKPFHFVRYSTLDWR
jgi:dipeptidyl aminopeptidase/acylaminoacyl peptidase